MPDTWTAKASNSVHLAEAAFDGRHGLLWLVGGRDANDPTTEVRNRRYIPATDTWEALGTIADLPAPAPRGNHKAFISDDVLYKFGNDGSTDTALRVFEYVVSTDTWTEKTAVSTTNGISTGSGAELGGKFYWFNGAEHRIYDPAADSWSTGAARPNAWFSPGVIGFRGLVHVVGGSGSFGAPQTHHDVYDPSTNTWDTATALPSARSGLAICAAGEAWIFAGGGVSSGSTPANAFWLYDPDLDSWIAKASSPSVDTAANARLAVLNQQVWMYDLEGNDLFVYDPDVVMPLEGGVIEGWGMLI